MSMIDKEKILKYNFELCYILEDRVRSVNSAREELQDAKNCATRAKIHQLAKPAFRDALEGFDKKKKTSTFILMALAQFPIKYKYE